ncbi:tRNA-dependent cyclodipeptide synthase [Amycolatopsis sp. cg5]|uniref:tRNA-dependent cyclodipeptide synthase n=1 Tax=Amycolatopsis sp. cg5 TaxID=3238802 RepID=UPI00352621B5
MSLPTSQVTFEPVNAVSESLLVQAKHAVVALSPFNSYYTQDIINLHIRAAMEHFEHINVVIPAMNMTLMFEACGLTRSQAEHKVDKNLRALRNRILYAFDEMLVPRRLAEQLLCPVDTLQGNPVYDTLLDNVRNAFHGGDPVFQEACMTTARGVILRLSGRRAEPTTEQKHAAMEFLFSEAAVMSDSPGIFKQGPSVHLYHRVVEFAGCLFDKQLTWTPAEHQGYAVIRPNKDATE